MTKQQIEKRFNVTLQREMDPYMGGRYYWSAIDNKTRKKVEAGTTLNDVAEALRISRAM